MIECYFYEPFYKLVIDTEAKTLTQVDVNWYDSKAKARKTKVLSTDVKVEKLGSVNVSTAVDVQRYRLKSSDEVVMLLTLSYQGRDGVFNFAYPYEAEYKHFSAAC